ncbi:hypothetical protein B0H13DRAFT_1932061 [Mycena leptocephala]|nr:hypothetical protein B0H13DRAFT_1932061 [Mycena leptocephala]
MALAPYAGTCTPEPAPLPNSTTRAYQYASKEDKCVRGGSAMRSGGCARAAPVPAPALLHLCECATGARGRRGGDEEQGGGDGGGEGGNEGESESEGEGGWAE